MTATITTVGSSDAGNYAIIEWRQREASGTEDALDLARRCVLAWEGYLRSHGLETD